MDIVVNTPHGDADVSIVEHGPDATLADLLAMVTGQAVPLLADVDGHPVTCSTRLSATGLAMGSVITTEPVPPAPATQSEIALVQLTGSGSGRAVRLGPGRYRIGPGRRLSADELCEAPVETGAFELTVAVADSPAETGTRTRVEVEVAPVDLRRLLLDSTPVETTTPWGDELLTAANRVFLLDDATSSAGSRSLAAPNTDGFIPFHRPPRRQPRADRRPVIDAVTDAKLSTAELWAQRSGQRGAFVVPLGMKPTEGRPTGVTLDLAGSPVVALTGHERFRTSMARTIIVELTTLHGPADLDIAILPGPDQTAAWEWAKWLPHVRLGGDPMIHRDRRAVTDWAARLGETAWGPGHLTLVVVDDHTQWTVPGSPLRELMTAAPEGLRVLALCERERDAPSGSAVIVTGSNDGSAHVELLESDESVVEFLPSLIETEIARIAAQHLAPLLDIEMTPRSAAVMADPGPADGANGDLVRVLGLTSVTAAQITSRWNSAEVGSMTVAVGYRDEQLVTLDLEEAGDILVTGTTIDDAVDCAATIALGLASIRPPGAVWISAVTADLFPQLRDLARLPHAATSTDTEGPVDVHRVIARIEAVLSAPTAPGHLLIVVPLTGGSGAAPLLGLDAIGSLLEASDRLPGLHVIVATDPLDSRIQDGLESQVTTTIRITTGRRATMVTTPAPGHEGDSTAAFSPYEPPRLVTNSSIELRPAVIGRQHTALERRLARAARRSSTAVDPGMNAVVDALRDAAAGLDVDPPVLIPAPLATSIDTGELFRAHQGDGVPIGMIDDVRDALARPLWWEPGSGPLVLFGSRRSGVDAVITTVLSGIIDRFAPADVHVVAIESSESRRSFLRTVEHVRAVAAPDSPKEVSAFLDVIAETLGRDRTSPENARLVVLVGDLALLRRDLGSLEERFDELLSAAVSENSGIDLVVYAGDRSTAGTLWHEGVRCLVGSSSDTAELGAFGIADPRSLDGVGRCRRFPGGELVQLAAGSTSLDAILIGDEP